MNKHNLLSFESFSKVERRYLFKSSVFYPLGAYMWQRTINFYMDHDEDSNAFVDEQRSSRIWNWITFLMFNPTPTALVRVCLETKLSPSIAVLLVRSLLLFFFLAHELQTFWRLLWSITEKTWSRHKRISFICLIQWTEKKLANLPRSMLPVADCNCYPV